MRKMLYTVDNIVYSNGWTDCYHVGANLAVGQNATELECKPSSFIPYNYQFQSTWPLAFLFAQLREAAAFCRQSTWPDAGNFNNVTQFESPRLRAIFFWFKMSTL